MFATAVFSEPFPIGVGLPRLGPNGALPSGQAGVLYEFLRKVGWAGGVPGDMRLLGVASGQVMGLGVKAGQDVCCGLLVVGAWPAAAPRPPPLQPP